MMFWLAPRLIARYGAQSLMSFCLAVTILRWTVTALYVPLLWLMFAAQCLHAFSFAAFHASCMRQISDLFPGKHAIGGQSLYFGFSSGVGGVLGAALASVLWEWRGGEAAFLGSAVVVVVAWIVYALRRKTAATTLA
jgi:PPP family 3-phenylpropionic acid transporter